MPADKVDLSHSSSGPNAGTGRPHTGQGFEAAPDRLEADTIYDAVTGLPGRNLFLDRLGKAIESARRDGRLTGVMVIAFDGPDGPARRAGGERSKRLATRLLDNLRGTDTVAHLGELTFGVIQVGARRLDDCFVVCRRLTRLFAQADDGGGAGAPRPTIGVAVADGDRESPAIWLQRAEAALRESDPRTCMFADPVHQARWQDHLNGERDLLRALREDQLELHYLPLVQPKDRRIIGLEALVRWRHPSRGLLPPSAFLPLAEACGQMGALGRWVLHRACADAAAWPSPLLQVMVNVSPAQVRQSDLVGEVLGALDASGLNPDRLVLEVGEELLLDAPDNAVPILNNLRSRGIGMALDDFGSGRSSLNVLQWFAFDRLKIDQRLIAESKRHPAAATVVRAIIAVARSMGVRVAAEGVDSQQKLTMLIQEGCDEVQGFYFGKPMPNRELHRMIELIDAHRHKPIWSGPVDEVAA